MLWLGLSTLPLNGAVNEAFSATGSATAPCESAGHRPQ
jgi:hypothetical protein